MYIIIKPINNLLLRLKKKQNLSDIIHLQIINIIRNKDK